MDVASLLALSLVAFGGVAVIRLTDQKSKDAGRIAYRLAFPQDLDSERVTAWVRSISGTLRHGPLLQGVPSVAFEVWATAHGIEHWLLVPWQHSDFIVAQLRTLVPGIHVVQDARPHRHWVKAVEVGLSHTEHTLRIYNAADAAATILASLQAIERDEAVVIQWVVSPAPPTRAPRDDDNDKQRDLKDKVAEPNVHGVLRVASTASTPIRADHLIHRVRSALASTRGPQTRFTRRMATMTMLQQRLDVAAAPLVSPVQLSAPELVALIAWPIGSPLVAGLPQSRSRHLPATESVPRVGRIIGHSNMPGNERNIAVSYEQALRHMHIIGGTGAGKTALMANMLKQDIEHGHGVVLIESKGDLFQQALDYIPPDRFRDVIVLDVQDATRPVGFNILQQGDPRVVIDELQGLFEHLYDTSSIWTKEVLYFGLRTLATDRRMTFVDLAPLLVPMTEAEGEWRDALIRSIEDAEVRQFWQRFDNQPRTKQDQITQPVMDRIWQLNARPEIRNIIGQSESAFTMMDVIASNKILLVNLSGLAKDTASLTGTLLMNSLWYAVKAQRPGKPNFLYLDEFQNFMKLPVDPEDMLAMARSFGLGMVLAHQHLDQLPTAMRSAVMANARTKVVFQTSAQDATAMSREFGASVSDGDFLHLGRFEALARVATGDGVSQPVSLATNAPSRPYGRAAQVAAISRERHGKAAASVAADIANRRTPPPVERLRANRPKLGGDWY